MSFEQDKQLAIIGEYTVWKALDELKGVKQVIDVRDDKRFQEWDIDLLIIDSNRQYHGVEVKTDWKAYDTGNFFFETKSREKVGCLERSKADYVAFFVPQSGNIYVCGMKAIRRCLSNHDYRLIQAVDGNIGYILPIGDLERFNCVEKMIQTTPPPIERSKDGRTD